MRSASIELRVTFADLDGMRTCVSRPPAAVLHILFKILFGDIGRKRREVLLWTTGVLKGGAFTSRLRYWDFSL